MQLALILRGNQHKIDKYQLHYLLDLQQILLMLEKEMLY